MAAEALVFVSQQHVEKARIDVGDRRRQAPAAVLCGVGAKQPAVAVEHLRRKFKSLAERHRAEPGDPADCGRQHGNERQRETGPNEAQSASHHFPAKTSTLPLSVRPKRSGRYISSTLACGRTYFPGATARNT